MLIVNIIPCLKDNYSYLILDNKTGCVGIVDPSNFHEVDRVIEKQYKKLDYILNTHHHNDHVGGNLKLKEKYSSKIIGFSQDRKRITGIDIEVKDEDIFKFGLVNFEAIHVPGHTSGHIIFYAKEEKIIFTGDTLFSGGCGRVFEGTIKEMFKSVCKIKNLPKNVKIYCGHEYTSKNLEFCLALEKNNELLKSRYSEVKLKNKKNEPTIPVTLQEELNTNIFLRCGSSALRKVLDMKNASEEQVFEKLRSLKDNF